MRYAKPRFWYHVTQRRWWGAKKELFPRNDGDNRPDSEPRIHRICVAPTLPQCIIAVPFVVEEPIFVYRTYRRCIAAIPWRVEDVSVTKERWLLQPTVFIKRLTIPGKTLDINSGISYGIREGVTFQREEMERLIIQLHEKGIPITP